MRAIRIPIASLRLGVAAPVDTTATPALKPAVPGRFAGRKGTPGRICASMTALGQNATNGREQVCSALHR